MDSRPVVVLLSLLCTTVSADELPETVFVRKPTVILVRPHRLPDVCRTRVKVYACTAFVGQVLTGSCRSAGVAWQLRARAQFIPVMYVTNGDHLAHEQEHIRDIEHAARAYVQGLAARAFDSEESCRAAASEESLLFPRLMDSFKDDSNALRHPQYQRVFARDLKPVIR